MARVGFKPRPYRFTQPGYRHSCYENFLLNVFGTIVPLNVANTFEKSNERK